MDIIRARAILKLDVSRKKPEEILELAEASWVYQGLPDEPHAILTSGLHSDGYFNVNGALQFSNLCEVLVKKLARQLPLTPLLEDGIDAVASSSFAALTFGAEVTRRLGVMSVFTEKKGKDQVWTGRFELPSGSRVLQVEELITTLGTTKKVKRAILEANPDVEFLEEYGRTFVGTVVHRPQKLVEYPDYKVISLIGVEVHNWEVEVCPLCEGGSVAKAPKPNWQEFQKYMQMKK